MTWAIQIEWNGDWITVEDGFKSRSDAEAATAHWKQANACLGDPFRRVQQSTPEDGFAGDKRLTRFTHPEQNGVAGTARIGE